MTEPPFPNRLRELRLRALVTREELAARTKKLEDENPAAYGAVSARSLERIEAGGSRPRLRVAAALAAAIGAEPSDLFPHGADDGVRNPEGKTRIPEGRPPRGKARKNS